MNILGIDASNNGLLISLKSNNDIYYMENKEKNSGNYIISMIDSLLKKNNLNLENIDLFGCTIGPGSFTGIRISIASIQGLLFNTNKKVVPIISTELIYNNYNGDKNKKIAILKKARVDAAYVHIFENGKTIFEPNLISINNLKNIIQDSILLGEESLFFKEKLKLNNETIQYVLSPNSIIEYIENNYYKAVSPKDLKVLYLQKPLAVENFEKKNNTKIDENTYN
ncbi:tRNA (adenosine(37)-N6)-threonylcarbamoyltransferase complex dimerization subunit type 1 TsaB [Marinitoga sp. 38H-ov]|uniref:tRNA (adenosine(37)-N6)-threonylcarbamoyltransferase complex dimerization subunit type 1 TsaB n=1 Tax=Marinitoga sp. 38H-ov TaxID=1755814 RepID=UPI0013EDFB3C|nr:tRNA (adenosine(37)-N6)-threonylcarbamoyltransferase complex dimerization subunit type 1 TsaB [Marinitoga sp. 38H-ov]KAF2956418.1 hypothetical protein AS160_05800 [Marinitoga sp. 38H-ov]